MTVSKLPVADYSMLSRFRKDEEIIEHHHRENTLHVGAVNNILQDLIKTLSSKLEIRGSKTYLDNDIEEHLLQAGLNGVDYTIDLQSVSCPVFHTYAMVHHALIVSPEDEKDEVTPIIQSEFIKYEEAYLKVYGSTLAP